MGKPHTERERLGLILLAIAFIIFLLNMAVCAALLQPPFGLLLAAMALSCIFLLLGQNICPRRWAIAVPFLVAVAFAGSIGLRSLPLHGCGFTESGFACGLQAMACFLVSVPTLFVAIVRNLPTKRPR